MEARDDALCLDCNEPAGFLGPINPDGYHDACDPELTAFIKAEEARGPLAFAPDTLPCYDDECEGQDRTVVALGGTVDRADPTDTYRLACGHIAA